MNTIEHGFSISVLFRFNDFSVVFKCLDIIEFKESWLESILYWSIFFEKERNASSYSDKLSSIWLQILYCKLDVRFWTKILD